MESSCSICFKVCAGIQSPSASFTLELDKCLRISDVKKLVVQKLKWKDLDLVVCGKVMDNCRTLADYNIAYTTSITVVHTHTKIPIALFPIRSQSYLTGMWLHRRPSSGGIIQRNHVKQQPFGFYVYCKDKCHDIVKGRLKVVCSKCSSSSIILCEEPNNWSDILPSTCQCVCYSAYCGQKKQFARFFFMCPNDECTECASPIKCIKDNLESKECCVCMDTEARVIEFPCKYFHIMCMDCFTSYAREELFTRRLNFTTSTGYNITCPCGCENSALNDPHVFYCLGEDEYRLYQEIATETCILQGMNGFICPNSNCGEGLFKPSNDRKRKCVCSKCGYEFCSDCKNKYHGDTKCTFIPHSSHAASEYISSVKTIRKISKTCPSCKVPIERNGGCMHLTCFKCKFEWCWLCETTWGLNCQERHWFG